MVTFRTTAKVLLHDFFSSPKTNDDEDEMLRVVRTAAATIKNDIKTAATASQQYSSREDIASVDKNLGFVPQSSKFCCALFQCQGL